MTGVNDGTPPPAVALFSTSSGRQPPTINTTTTTTHVRKHKQRTKTHSVMPSRLASAGVVDAPALLIGIIAHLIALASNLEEPLIFVPHAHLHGALAAAQRIGDELGVAAPPSSNTWERGRVQDHQKKKKKLTHTHTAVLWILLKGGIHTRQHKVKALVAAKLVNTSITCK